VPPGQSGDRLLLADGRQGDFWPRTLLYRLQLVFIVLLFSEKQAPLTPP
jgi:hypothetical protein